MLKGLKMKLPHNMYEDLTEKLLPYYTKPDYVELVKEVCDAIDPSGGLLSDIKRSVNEERERNIKAVKILYKEYTLDHRSKAMSFIEWVNVPNAHYKN